MLSIKVETSLAGRDPEPAPGVLVEFRHVIVAQAVRVAGVVLVGGEGVAVVAVRISLRPDPHEALTVLEDGRHPVVKEG